MKGNRQLILSSWDDEICILGSVHHVSKTKRLKISDIQVLSCLKKRNVRPSVAFELRMNTENFRMTALKLAFLSLFSLSFHRITRKMLIWICLKRLNWTPDWAMLGTRWENVIGTKGTWKRRGTALRVREWIASSRNWFALLWDLFMMMEIRSF